MYNEINGNLISLALAGEFDVIAHGCNCFCTMGAGLAILMKEQFGCNMFPLEDNRYKGNINKLGQIDWDIFPVVGLGTFKKKPLFIVNAYTQYHYGSTEITTTDLPLNYSALTLCMKKINYTFKGKHVGLPKIGSSLAGGNWEVIKQIIKQELKDCDVTVVIYNK
jgi:O-acetyl-ADP-ribose deacetylase (regulator of RNase III)